MDLARPALFAGLLLPGSCRALHSEAADQSLTFAAGSAAQGSEGWGGFEDTWIASFDYAVEPYAWPCGVEVGGQFGAAAGPDLPVRRDVDLSEFWFGATRGWQPAEWLRLQAGVGLRFAQAHLMGPGFIFDDEIDSDTSSGIYAHLGAFARIAGPVSVGLDARWADGSDFSLEGVHRDAQLTQLLLALRWDF